MNRVFAVVGMCGSGKSEACDVLRELGWRYIRFGQLTIDRLRARGKEITAENEKQMREGLRREHGMGAFALLLLPAIEDSLARGDVIIDGLYSWSEYKILKQRFGDGLQVVHVHASPRTRYRRLESRRHEELDKDHRMRALSAAAAESRDYAEIENIEKGGPIAMADFCLVNEGTLAELENGIRALAADARGDRA